MGNRKFTADQLFTGYAMLGPESVLVTDEAGVVQDIVMKENAGDDVQHFAGIISPGFINCHCHLELAHMHGVIPQNSGMTTFLLSVMNKRRNGEAGLASAMIDAEQQMRDTGTVAVGDICNTNLSVGLKTQQNLYYHNFIEALGFTASKAEIRFKEAVDIYVQFLEAGLSRVSIVPHSPYSVSDHLFRLINEHEKGSILTIHNQESVAETEFFTTGKGELLELYQALGIDTDHFKPSKQSSLVRSIIKITGDHSVLLVHNVNTTSDDLDAIRRGRNLPQLYWCLCPNANIYINGRLPDVQLLKNFNCKMVVGTDSLASNTQLNILEELKTLQKHFNTLSTVELLRWATINGAEALRIDQHYGSFEHQKQPGLVHIETKDTGSLAGAVSKRIL